MTVPIAPIRDVRPLFPVERAALRAVLGDLSPAEWAAPTVCPGWDVHDVVAHVVNDHVRRLAGGRDGHAGAVFADDETLPAYLDRVNGEFVAAMRQASPPVLIDLLAHLGPQLDAWWDGVDLAGPAPLDVSWAGGPSPAWLDVAREFTELWMHQQQIRDAVGRPGADDPELLGPVVRTLVHALPHALSGLERPAGTAVELTITGPAGGTWRAVRDGGAWRLARDTAEDPSAQVTVTPDDLWRLASRGIPVAEARRRARLAGDRALLDAATTLLAIVA